MSIEDHAIKAVKEWYECAGKITNSSTGGLFFEHPIDEMTKEECFIKGYESGASVMLQRLRKRLEKVPMVFGFVKVRNIHDLFWTKHPMVKKP